MSILVVILIKESGRMIKDKDRAPFILKNQVINTSDNGKMIICTVKVNSLQKTKKYVLKENFKMVYQMAMVLEYSKITPNSLENIKMEKPMEKENTSKMKNIFRQDLLL